ncbi:MAG: hypothetical protein H6624_07015 [Bdellovibrionaceae bacterium]|nr:hypothetical protein [Bdellovibrionales bacterium]MCB9084077.1 hypothetical protein [Pseudobdellovibrionaceae bacterium]
MGVEGFGWAEGDSIASENAFEFLDSLMPLAKPRELVQRLRSLPSSVLWELLLEVKSQVQASGELRYLFNSRSWNYSEKILEAGFGSEMVAGSVRSYFTEKKFLELAFPFREWEPDYWVRANKVLEGEITKERVFDFILLRLTRELTHINPQTFARILPLIKRGGFLALIDLDTATLAFPERKLNLLEQVIRPVMPGLEAHTPFDTNWLDRTPLFVIEDRQERIEISDQGDKENLLLFLMLRIEWRRRAVGEQIQADFLIEKLQEWLGTAGESARMNIRATLLGRPSSR